MGALRKRRLFAMGGAAVIMTGTMVGAVGFNALPAGASPNPVLSEFDCQGSTPVGVEDVPIVAGTVGATVNINPSYPTGSGLSVSGEGIVVVPGPINAGLFGAFGPESISLTGVTASIGSTDGSATGGPYTWSPTFTAVTPAGGRVSDATAASGASVITSASDGFTAAAVGQSVAGDELTGSSADINPASVIVAVGAGGSSITLSTPTLGALSGATIAFAGSGEYTGAFSTGAIFTAAGSSGGASNFGITALGGGVVAGGDLSFGDQSGSDQCFLTGYDASGTAATNGLGTAGAPLLPLPGYEAAGITPLVTVNPNTAPAGASTSLEVYPPVAAGNSINIAENSTSTYQLSATNAQPSNGPATPPALSGWAVSAASGPGAGSITSLSVDANGLVTIVNDSASATTASFTWTVHNAGGTSNAATINLSIGTPPVDQPITEQVTGGQLVLTCTDPEVSQTPNLACATLGLPGVTLNGSQQTVTAATPSNVWVSDNRGTAATWSLTAQMVASSVGNNPNATCGSVAAFCNTAGNGADAAHNQIPGANLGIAINQTTGCVVDPGSGNTNPNPAPGAPSQNFGAAVSLCSAASGSNSGSFEFTGTYSLTVPSSVYSGTYVGTVEYLVA